MVSIHLIQLSSNKSDFFKVNHTSYLQNIKKGIGRTLSAHLGYYRLGLKSFVNQLACERYQILLSSCGHVSYCIIWLLRMNEIHMLRIGPIMINLRQVVRVHHNHFLLRCYQHLQIMCVLDLNYVIQLYIMNCNQI